MVEQAGAPGEGAVVVVGRRARQVVGVAAVGPVVAAAEQQHEAVELDLVLRVDAGLDEPVVDVAGERQRRDLGAVFGVEGVDRGDGARPVRIVVPHAAEIEPEQHGVVEPAGVELRLQLVVERDGIDVVGELERGAVEGAEILLEADRMHGRLVAVQIDVAKALADGPDIAEPVLELVAGHELVAAVIVEARLAQVPARRDFPVRVGKQRPLRRIVRAGPVVDAVALELAVDRERRVGIRPPRDARRQEELVVLDEVDLIFAHVPDGGEPVEELAVRIDRPAEVEGGAEIVEAAELEQHLVERLRRRALADQVDQAAGRALAVEHRGGAFEHLDALEAVGLDARPDEAAMRHAHAVEIDVGQPESAHPDPLHARVVAVLLGLYARRVAQRLADCLRALRRDLVRGDDRDGLRRLDQRRVRLRARGALSATYPSTGPRASSAAPRTSIVSSSTAAPPFWPAAASVASCAATVEHPAAAASSAAMSRADPARPWGDLERTCEGSAMRAIDLNTLRNPLANA